MTFRAKPVVKRAHRPAWEGQDRRNFYLNLGFGLIVVLAVLILAVAAGLSWYNDHLAPIGSVDGQNVTKDEFRDRVAIETWRLDEAKRRIRTEVLAGHLTESQATVQNQVIAQQEQQLPAISLERIIDSKLQAKLAVGEGVAVTPADVDARLVVEATTPESRHAWVIEVKPVTDVGAVAPTDAQKAAAKSKAEAAIKEINGGKSWDDVAKTVSTDASSAPQAGDLGWIQADDSQADEAYLKAVFAGAVNTPTAVIEGVDGIYRIGRVTEIVPEAVDSAYQAKLQNDGVDLAKYREVVQGDVVHEKLSDKIVAAVTGPGPQRHVAEIYIADPDPKIGTGAVKVRHILFSPNNDPSGAATLPVTDPAWAVAQSEATAAYARLKTNPELFDSMARSESDEGSALGVTGTGGKLPYFDGESTIDEAFKAAILAPGLAPGSLLPPVKSSFGWHVIQVMYRPTDLDHLNAVKAEADNGKDFGELARDNSEATTAGTGGDLGWIAKGQLDERLTAGIFGTDVGKTSNVIIIKDDGIYLFKVLAEETRTPEGRQLTELTSTAFSSWYDLKKASVIITRDPSITDTAG
jgi:parvulin-like peptidyl-prolyl isomerase